MTRVRVSAAQATLLQQAMERAARAQLEAQAVLNALVLAEVPAGKDVRLVAIEADALLLEVTDAA